MCSLLCVVAYMSQLSRLLYYILDRLIAEVPGSVNLYNCNRPSRFMLRKTHLAVSLPGHLAKCDFLWLK